MPLSPATLVPARAACVFMPPGLDLSATEVDAIEAGPKG